MKVEDSTFIGRIIVVQWNMPSFLYPLPIALSPDLIALPMLIHLINMMRHRQIEWAAMEFLLVSQKRNRTWVMLKQLLLLCCGSRPSRRSS